MAQEPSIRIAGTGQKREPSVYNSERIESMKESRVKFSSEVEFDIESMKESRVKFSSEVEFDIESSKVHWTELDSTLHKEHDTEHSPDADRQHFEMLLKHPSWFRFFGEFSYLSIGKKIAEGAQGDIYEALYKEYDFNAISCFWVRNRTKYVYVGHVVKVMKEGYSVLSLQEQWPLAFLMRRGWGDLRKLIDLQMLHKDHGPPFSLKQVKILMKYIAHEMHNLHQVYGIVHRDLKTSNVLLYECDLGCKHSLAEQKLSEKPLRGSFELMPRVVDFVCSVGVVGTRFWRAPEFLQQIKDKVPSCDLEFTKKADVYSYGMTCYEIVTGLVLFEGCTPSNYDLVLSGNRPGLPHDLDPLVKYIIVNCWHRDPVFRPTFREILRKSFDIYILPTERWDSVP